MDGQEETGERSIAWSSKAWGRKGRRISYNVTSNCGSNRLEASSVNCGYTGLIHLPSIVFYQTWTEKIVISIYARWCTSGLRFWYTRLPNVQLCENKAYDWSWAPQNFLRLLTGSVCKFGILLVARLMLLNTRGCLWFMLQYFLPTFH